MTHEKCIRFLIALSERFAADVRIVPRMDGAELYIYNTEDDTLNRLVEPLCDQYAYTLTRTLYRTSCIRILFGDSKMPNTLFAVFDYVSKSAEYDVSRNTQVYVKHLNRLVSSVLYMLEAYHYNERTA